MGRQDELRALTEIMEEVSLTPTNEPGQGAMVKQMQQETDELIREIETRRRQCQIKGRLLWDLGLKGADTEAAMPSTGHWYRQDRLNERIDFRGTTNNM